MSARHAAISALLLLASGCSLDLDRLRGANDAGASDIGVGPDAHAEDAGGEDASALDAPSADAAIDAQGPDAAPADAPAPLDAPLRDAPSADAPGPDVGAGGCVPACESGSTCVSGSCVAAFRFGLLYTGPMAGPCAAGRDATVAVLACVSTTEARVHPLSRTGCGASVGSHVVASGVGGGGTAVAVADLDRDGAIDVIAADASSLRYAWGTPSGLAFTTGGSTGHGAGMLAAIAVGNLDPATMGSEMLLDIVLFERGARSQWFRHTPARALNPGFGAPSGSGITTRDGLAVPMDGDTIPDIVRLYTIGAAASIAVTSSMGDGRFGGSTTVGVGAADHMAFLPVTMTGSPAIVATGPTELHVVTPGSTLSSRSSTLPSSALLDVVAADIDGDGTDEVVVADASGGGRLRAFRVGAASLTELLSTPVATLGTAPALAAVDIDGRNGAEIVVWTETGQLHVLGRLDASCP